MISMLMQLNLLITKFNATLAAAMQSLRCVLLCGLALLSCLASSWVAASESHQVQDLWPVAQFLAIENTQSIEQVHRLPAAKWQPTSTIARNLDPKDNDKYHYWLRIDAADLADLSSTLLVNKFAFVAVFDVYLVTDKQIIQYQGGQALSQTEKSKDIVHPVVALPASIPPDAVLYIMFSSENSVLMLPLIGEESTIRYVLLKDQLFTFLYLAIIGTLILYNLFMAINSWHRRFLWYCAYHLSVMAFILSYSGQLRLLWPPIQYPHEQLMVILAITGMYLLPVMFLYKHNPFSHIAWRIVSRLSMATAGCIIPVYLLASGAPTLYIIMLSLLTFIVFLLLSLVLSIKAKNWPNSVLVLGWLINVSGSLAFLIMVSGAIPYSWFSFHVFHLATLIEALIFAFVLAYQFRSSEIRRWQLESRFNTELQRQVTKQVSELEKLNTELERQAWFDPLTGAYNRVTMNKRLQQLQQTQVPCCLILMDLDDFKLINDRCGHMIGDNCLKFVTLHIQSQIRDDNLYRFGGEEFLVIIEHLDKKQGGAIAERIRQKVESSVFMDHDHQIMMTLSIGVVDNVSMIESNNQFLDRADKALYMAKTQGKNQVVIA